MKRRWRLYRKQKDLSARGMNNIEFWDGTYNGKLMPSDDYWFYITREDGEIHKGHFGIIR